MRRYFCLIFLSFIFLNPSFSQDEDEKENFLDHYVGLQVNELLRQILNLNTSALPANDYYLNYTINHHQTGWGVNFGFGYDYRNIHEGDAINSQETSIDAWSVRFGPEKKFRLGKGVLLGLGCDYFISSSVNITTFRINDSFDQFSETVLEEGSESTGIAPRLSISYKLSNWLMVGTEVTYSYSYSKFYQEGIDRTSFSDFETYQEIEDEYEERNFVFHPPTIVYLILTF